MQAMINTALRCGMVDFGVSDHLHAHKTVPMVEASRRAFDEADRPAGLRFGVEVSCLRRHDIEVSARTGEEASVYAVQKGGPVHDPLALFLDEAFIERLGIEYVIGGAHWPLGAELEREAVIQSYHRQNTFLATHPLVDVVAHPWWWMGHWQDKDGMYRTKPWLDDFSVIPESMHLEFASALTAHNTAVEINAHACLLNPSYPTTFRSQYMEYLMLLKDEGVQFSVGSDSHDERYSGAVHRIEGNLNRLGIGEEDLWRPAEKEIR